MADAVRKRTEVLIVDDFPVVRAGLRGLIDAESDLRVAAEAADGREAIEFFRIYRPDVVLMDLRMPEVNGLEATRRICAASRGDCRVVVLTGSAGDVAVYQALEAGAKAYLLKTAPPAEILKAIRAVAAGRRYLPPSIREQLAERMACGSLTRRELEILELIIYGLSNAEISYQLNLTEGTIKGHINRILSKMQVSDRTQAAVAALSRGIFLWTEAEMSKNFPKT
jgi:two-component system, NarL family, response regulator